MIELEHRRSLLLSHANPSRTLDYVVSLKSLNVNGGYQITLRYIPDKLILSEDHFQNYVKHMFSDEHTETIETFATTILEDVMDELVCRWVQVSLYLERTDQNRQHQVVVEDKQPQWENSYLLNRLAPIG